VGERLVFRESIYTFHIDFNRHVSNIVYIQWMEIGRLKLLGAIGLDVEKTAAGGAVPVLVETQITYKRPLFLGDTVQVEVWLSELSGVSAWMEFRFTNAQGDLVARARQRGVFVHAETGRPKRLTREEQAAFARYLERPAGGSL
jgi:acyl-CoA thioester hydrolase